MVGAVDAMIYESSHLRAVRNFLNNTYPRWIGRGGHIPWPPRSPDLNPLDFFVWGSMKAFVYNGIEVANEEDLQQRIFQAAAHIREDRAVFNRLLRKFTERVQACIDANGGHFEHLL